MGGQAETVAGLCGLGDLVLTCSSPQSRNMSLGLALGQGQTVEQALAGKRSVAEGYESAPAVRELTRKLGVDTPICEATAAVLALTAAACSAEKEAPAPAEAAASALTGRAALYAAGEKDAEAFVRALYARAAAPQTTPDPAEAAITPGRDPLYSRTLNALIGVDFREAQSRDEDADSFALKTVTMTPDGPQAATAEVVFTNHGRERRQTLKLVKEGPMWRIADIIDDKGKSLHDDLMAIAEKAEG
ncbi:hypothetical protein LTR94_027828 [Friedmanniomyces endolithicus]|nr:hypothetical protein LTR94_027828 [Friedmanniomyces endolithicus]